MKRFSSVLISVVVLVVFSAGFAFAQPPVKALVDDACSKCHSIKRVYSANKNLAEWGITLDRMIKKGAKINPEERDTVLKYLNTLNK
jgi:ABC-type microcin C transport system permease subunit YejB